MAEPSIMNSLTRPFRIFVHTWPNSKSGGILRDAEFIQNCFQNDPNFLAITQVEKSNLQLWKIMRKSITFFRFLGFKWGLNYKEGFPAFLPQVAPLAARRKRVPYVIRIHDVFPISNPSWFRVVPRWNFWRFLSEAADRNDVFFLCNSETTETNLLNAFPNKVLKTLVYPCQIPIIDSKICHTCSFCQTIESVVSPFLLMVGTVEPRKDYPFIIRVCAEFGDSGLPIIIVGRRGWKCYRTIRDLKSTKNISWFDDCCDGGLNYLYKNASAFVSTSKDEGFNLPAAEAHQFGVPLFLRNVQVHKEFHADHAFFFSNEEDLIALIQDPDIYSRTQVNKKFLATTQFPSKEIIEFLEGLH